MNERRAHGCGPDSVLGRAKRKAEQRRYEDDLASNRRVLDVPLREGVDALLIVPRDITRDEVRRIGVLVDLAYEACQGLTP